VYNNEFVLDILFIKTNSYKLTDNWDNLYGKTSPDNNEIRKRIKKLELERVLMKIRTPITENRRNVPT
jgi:elongation factor P hydroxylase